jgi:hypothetical protein
MEHDHVIDGEVPVTGQKRRSGVSHPTCIATLPSQLSLAEGDAVLFTPLDGHLPKFDLLEPIPSVPQVVFGE